MHSLQYNQIAHNTNGSSDKVYIACMRKLPNNHWVVLGKWGRRLKNMNVTAKGEYDTEAEAIMAMGHLFQSRLNEGYVDINSPGYNGAVTAQSVKRFLEPDPGATVDQKKVPVVPAPDDVALKLEAEKALRKMKMKEAEQARKEAKEAKVADAPAKRRRCLDAMGMEDYLAEGEMYDTFLHEKSDMLWVALANRRIEAFKERFQ